MRSAQPTTQLSDWAKRYRLKSIVNLRGGGPGDWWYGMEIRSLRENGMTYYDLPLSATRRPTRRELLQLIDLLDHCSYPLLIHCKSGADRTGLASALYRMVRRGEPPESALASFSIEFGHVPFFGTEHLHEPLEEYAAWLKSGGLTHSAASVSHLGQERIRRRGSAGRPASDQARPARPAILKPTGQRTSIEQISRPHLLKLGHFGIPARHDLTKRPAGENVVVRRPIGQQALEPLGLPLRRILPSKLERQHHSEPERVEVIPVRHQDLHAATSLPGVLALAGREVDRNKPAHREPPPSRAPPRTLAGSIQGAPMRSKGVSVPRPVARFVASSRPTPG